MHVGRHCRRRCDNPRADGAPDLVKSHTREASGIGSGNLLVGVTRHGVKAVCAVRPGKAVRRGASVAADRSRDAVQRAVSKQTRRTVRSGIAGGIFWMSQKLALLADKVMPGSKPPTQPPAE